MKLIEHYANQKAALIQTLMDRHSEQGKLLLEQGPRTVLYDMGLELERNINQLLELAYITELLEMLEFPRHAQPLQQVIQDYLLRKKQHLKDIVEHTVVYHSRPFDRIHADLERIFLSRFITDLNRRFTREYPETTGA